jgi:D-aspartate ligase
VITETQSRPVGGESPLSKRLLRTPVLLTMPAYGGTLAAVRQLGSNGVPVVVAGHDILAAARWSHYASRFVSCPPVQESDRFIEWLIAYGERQPGHVLLPTSDETALLFASNLKLLERYFRLYQPPLESTLRVLDKKRLWEACRRAGIDTLPSWFPSDEGELRGLAAKLPFPLLIKPRTQVRRVSRDKGVVVRSLDDLLPSYRAVASQERYLTGCNKLRDAYAPMLQQFAEEANKTVYSVSGFIDRSGEVMAVRGATKVLQRNRPVGIGVCFEASPLEDELVEAVKRLCHEVGHFGVFEVEFLRLDRSWAVIDFNPRFYHQMGLDIARGMPLPMWAYLGACGEESVLRVEVQRAAHASDGPASIFCDRFTFRALLTAMTITGRLRSQEAAQWKRWYEDHRAGAVDVAIDVSDPLPGFVHALSELKLGLQALPRFLRIPTTESRTALPLRERETVL